MLMNHKDLSTPLLNWK